MKTMSRLLSGVDRGTRAFWRLTGRQVDLEGAESWLQAPTHDEQRVGDGWPAAAAERDGGDVVADAPSAGLLPDLALLDGPQFSAAAVHPDVRDFYEHTSDWDMEVRTAWSRAFRPAGEVVARLFARRVQQLAIPTGRSGDAQGMDSRVALICGPDGEQRAAAWIRTLSSTGEHVYSGCYSVRRLPGGASCSVHVAFPLEAGNIQVFLSPEHDGQGGLRLTSPSGGFGENGAYVVVHGHRGAHAARIPIREDFHVFVGDDGVLRTDHQLWLWSAPAVRLDYRLSRR